MTELDTISPNGFSLSLWHASNNGHSNIVKSLLQYETNIEIINKEASDGTTPLMMAIAKGHFQTAKCFEKCIDKSRMVLEFAKFGRIYDVDNSKVVECDKEAFRNAVLSGNFETINHMKSMTNDFEFPSDIEDHVIDKEILKFAGYT